MQIGFDLIRFNFAPPCKLDYRICVLFVYNFINWLGIVLLVGYFFEFTVFVGLLFVRFFVGWIE